MTTYTHAGREKARRERVKVCEECGDKYTARSHQAMYCETCRPIVHRRRTKLNHRRKRGFQARVEGLTCTHCGKKQPHEMYTKTEAGRYRKMCRNCYTPKPKTAQRYKPAIPPSWVVDRDLRPVEALLVKVGGPSPCFGNTGVCKHLERCRERVAALDDKPLPCFEGGK